ncbi:hypothetical protein JCM16303_001275 [Sporobolomyces ruberrimus]
MRRIFGGSTLTGSSTSNSLSSDSLASPISPAHERSPPLTPVYETHFRRDEDPDQQKKGWFGGLVRTTSSSATTTINSGGGGASVPGSSAAEGKSTTGTGTATSYDDLEAERLPFGASRSPSALISSPRNGHFRQTSRSSASLGSAFGGSSGRPFSPEGMLAEGQATVPKDAIMIELLSGQAAIEAKDFDVLDWEQVQEIKKEHSLLANRIASLTRSVTLETRLRDSAAKLVRLSAPPSSSESSRTPMSSPARRQVTREQAEAQLATAQNKLDTVQGELYKVGWKEAILRTKLLKHTAGVLALSARKRDEEEQGLAPTPLSPALTQLGSSLNRSQDTPSPTGTSTVDHRFDGAHFFSGNREAVMPLPRSANSPFTSPAPSQGAFAPPMNLHQHQDQFHELETQITRLEAEKGRSLQDLEQARREIELARKEGASTRERALALERDVTSLRQGLERAEEDVARARKEAEGLRHETSLARSTSTDHRREIDSAQDEARDAGNKAKELELEVAELEMKLAEAEQKTHELESEVDEVKLEKKSNEQEWAARLEEVETRSRAGPDEVEESVGERDAKRRVEELEEDQRKMVQAIGDVLRRHRTRPILGSVLRETPSFDDTTHREDLVSYLASTLDAHFEKVSSHVTHLNEELSTVRNDIEGTRSALESDLNQAHDRHGAIENELESLRIEKDLLQQSLDSAHSQSSGLENRLASIPILEQNLSTAITNETKTREEFSASQAKIASLETQLAEVSTQHTKSTKVLQDLFKSLPPLDTRPLPEHGADDLASLKNAFDPNARRQLGNFIAGITSSDGKFSIEGLAERIKLLMAEDQKVVQRLSAFETEKASVEKTRKAVEEKSADLQLNERKFKELEERLEVSSQQEVTMLERLNDLTESLEQTRSDKRKLEAQLAQLQAQSPAPATASAANSGDVEELHDQIADLEEELRDAKAREQKVRSQLLDELSAVQGEVSSLKTQLRQAQRKMGK